MHRHAPGGEDGEESDALTHVRTHFRGPTAKSLLCYANVGGGGVVFKKIRQKTVHQNVINEKQIQQKSRFQEVENQKN